MKTYDQLDDADFLPDSMYVGNDDVEVQNEGLTDEEKEYNESRNEYCY